VAEKELNGSDEQKDFLEGIKRLNIEARYQEIKDEVARTLNRKVMRTGVAV
jgi:hypothetical protein